jgi:hypothetical protein
MQARAEARVKVITSPFVPVGVVPSQAVVPVGAKVKSGTTAPPPLLLLGARMKRLRLSRASLR